MVTTTSDPTDRGAEAPALEFSVDVDSDSSTVVLCGELDAETCCLFAGVVDGQIANHHLDLSVDLSRLAFFDLAGVDALRAAQARMRQAGGRLVVVGYDDLFARVARLCDAEGLLGES